MYHMALWDHVDLLSKLQCQFFFLIHQPPAIAYRVKLKTLANHIPHTSSKVLLAQVSLSLFHVFKFQPNT